MGRQADGQTGSQTDKQTDMTSAKHAQTDIYDRTGKQNTDVQTVM